MSYLVLARKYRPQTLAEVVGQEHVSQTLTNAFLQNRVHHAFLFCGPRGCGKTTTARILGKALNCEKGAGPTPCGVCTACVTITNGSAMDYREMDGASNRGIDAIRELTEAVRYEPAAMRKKVYVIDEVHMLTTEAFNALLKTLEEPPPHVTFILATTEPHKIPNTILSRCQRYDFKLVGTSRMAAHLKDIFAREQITAESGAIDIIVRESGGSVRDALSLSDQVISYVGQAPLTEKVAADVLGVADRSLLVALMAALAEQDAARALTLVDEAVIRGLDVVQIARALVRYLRDLAVTQAAPDARGLVEGSSDEIAALSHQAQAFGKSRVRLMFARMLKAVDEMAQTEEARWVLDLALIDLAASEPLVPIDDLLAQIERLEKGGGGGGMGGAGKSRPTGTSPMTNAPSPDLRARPAPTASNAPVPREPTIITAVAAPAIPSAGQAAPVTMTAAAAPVPTPAPTAPGLASATESSRSASGSGPHAVSPPGAPQDPLRAWADVISALEAARELSLAGVYQNAKILSWTDSVIEVGFAKDAMLGELAAESEKLASMKKFLTGLGYLVTVKVKHLSPDEMQAQGSAMSIIEAEATAKKGEHDKRLQEAQAHPMTRMVLETFGANIDDIKTQF